LYSSYYSLGVITFIYEQILSERLFESVSKRHKKAGIIISSALQSKYKSFMVKSDEFLLGIKLIKNNAAKIKKANKYLNKYFYINTGYSMQAASSVEDILSKADKIEFKRAAHSSFHEKAEFTYDERIIIKLFKPTETIRDQRKKINLIGTFTMHAFMSEVIKRSGVSEKLAIRAFWYELQDLLEKPGKMEKILKRRKYISGILSKGHAYYLDYMALVPRDKKSRESFCKGVPASKGVVKGKVFIVLGPKDFHKFKTNRILVTEMTRPDFVPLMKMASAVVTDEGGLTSHAAIVARELSIPCVIGTKIATQVFKDGDLVEVDANKGIVRKLSSK